MVQKIRTNSSNELYDNRSDESRTYDIESNIHIVSGSVSSTDGGNVFRDGVQVTSFNSWSENHINMTYMGVTEEEQVIINGVVNSFLREVKKSVSNN